jgi:hypothetical protein
LTRFQDLSKVVIRQHLDAYFEQVAPIPCYGFLHYASLIHKWQHGKCNPRLLKAICGVTARFLASDNSDGLIGPSCWIEEAEKEIMSHPDSLAVSDIEALMLIALEHGMARRFVRMLTSSCLAARMAYIMRLNHENPRLGSIARESRRRLMWAIFVFDTIYSSGRAELTSCQQGTIHIQLPCREGAFSSDIPVVTTGLREPSSECIGKLGTTAFLIRILDIRDRIQRSASFSREDCSSDIIQICPESLTKTVQAA